MRFLDPTGQPTYGIAICARCQRKFLLAQLRADPNTGLMVCEADRDKYDPYMLPFNPKDANISLPYTRPDVPLDETGTDPVTTSGLP